MSFQESGVDRNEFQIPKVANVMNSSINEFPPPSMQLSDNITVLNAQDCCDVSQGSIDFQSQTGEIITLDAVEKQSASWKDVDILVFNSRHWWTYGNKTTT
jgi:hypothetical protein